MECDAQASATRSRETLCRPYLMHPPNTVTVQQPKSLQASLPSWAAAANSSNSVIPRRYRTVTGMLPGTDWFLARRFGTPCPRSDRRQRPMIKQSTLHAALSLVALIAGCSHDTPAGPSATRAGLVAATVADEDAAATYAVIGDMPYGKNKLDSLPQLIALINGDQAVQLVIHVGDIKAGSNSPCTDAYFATVKGLFDTFEDPLVYTIGDNEWTDCHVFSKKNGLYTPSERLQAIRTLFFPAPGQTLGLHTRAVFSQANDPNHSQYVENVRRNQRNVVFAAMNITGSFNDLAPWSSASRPWLVKIGRAHV